MIFDRLELPAYRKAINPLKKPGGYMLNIGADSETVYGKPNTFQFYSPELNLDDCVFCDETSITKLIIQYLRQLPTRNQYIIWSHNLQFDLIEYFFPYYENFLDTEFDIKVPYGRLSGVYSNPTFARLELTGKRVFHFLDTLAFFKTTLKNLAQTFCPNLPKLEPPAKLGEKRFTEKNKKFIKYAMQDAIISYHVGAAIDGYFQAYDVGACVSGPHFASKVFRRNYLKKPLPFPDKRIMYSSLLSYHGGKNTFAAAPGIYQDVKIADITSQYPYAMTQLPDFSDLSKYKIYKGPAESIRPFGVYCIQGTVKPCVYPILFDHDFKPLFGKVSRVWVSGFELQEAVRAGEFRGTAYGYFYDGKAGGPLRDYCLDFFKKKDTATNQIDKQFNKINLNSLYGKFIQKTVSGGIEAEYDIDADKFTTRTVIKGGPMFHPLIATLITGHARVQLHKLEHKYQSLHSATDSVATQNHVKQIDGLGGLKIEAKGDFIAYRNKLYMLIYRGRVLKYALHGFRGRLNELIQMSIDNRATYSYKKMNKLKESHRRGLTVNQMDTYKASLKTGMPIDIHKYFKGKGARWQQRLKNSLTK